MSLRQLAEDMGLKVERRPVSIEELPTFEEAAECGTAAVVTPISRIDDLDENRSYIYSADGKPGARSESLYRKLVAIQTGDDADPYGWTEVINQ
jgi:branched-chain amino acid aminotransferase